MATKAIASSIAENIPQPPQAVWRPGWNSPIAQGYYQSSPPGSPFDEQPEMYLVYFVIVTRSLDEHEKRTFLDRWPGPGFDRRWPGRSPSQGSAAGGHHFRVEITAGPMEQGRCRRVHERLLEFL